MQDYNMDLRVIRTREAIRNALVELIEEKGFEATTVKDITTKANINRSTFYAHYQDKFDLMNTWLDEVMLQMYNIGKKEMPRVLAEIESNSSSNLLSPAAVSIFDYLAKNSGFMKAVLSPKGDLTFQIKLKDFIWNTLFENSTISLLKDENLLVPRQYLTSYISSAHIGVIQQWLNSGMIESPKEMAQILSTITLNGPLFAAGLKR